MQRLSTESIPSSHSAYFISPLLNFLLMCNIFCSPLCGHVAGADYDGATIEGVVETGVTVTDVTVTIFDDDIEELDVESFRLSLALFDPPAGVQLGASQEGVVSIIDDDSESVCVVGTVVWIDSIANS